MCVCCTSSWIIKFSLLSAPRRYIHSLVGHNYNIVSRYKTYTPSTNHIRSWGWWWLHIWRSCRKDDRQRWVYLSVAHLPQQHTHAHTLIIYDILHRICGMNAISYSRPHTNSTLFTRSNVCSSYLVCVHHICVYFPPKVCVCMCVCLIYLNSKMRGAR